MAKAPASKLRHDDFVAAVHPDPAKPEPTLLLSGFVGRADAAGTARIYPDQTLGTWYDVAEADIVHTRPNPDAPLGGSYVWVKANAPIKPGTAAPAAAARAPYGMAAQAGAQPLTMYLSWCVCDAPAANAAPAPLMQTDVLCSYLPCRQTQYLCCTEAKFCTWWNCTYQGALAGVAPAAAAGMGAGVFNPMLPTADCAAGGARAAAPAPYGGPQAAAIGHPTPQTHCFVCDPLAARQGAAAAQPAAMAPTPTPATHCFVCPPHTQDWNCHGAAQADPRLYTYGCASVVCAPLHPPTPELERFAPTPATHCFVCQPALPFTQMCLSHNFYCTPRTPHCLRQAPTPATVCTQLAACPTVRCGVFNPFGG